MRILVVGASGFIGKHIVVRLRAAGHNVICAGRNPAWLARIFPGCDTAQVDLATDTVQAWIARLQGVDAVINAAGILRGDVETVQHRGTVRLFNACASANISCVLQISALGAGAEAAGPFLKTKGLADAYLIRLAQAPCRMVADCDAPRRRNRISGR